MNLQLVFMFGFGISVGSFLNLLSLRIPHKRTVIKGRSSCPSCGHVLGACDLIPLLSFILLRGRCRHCREKISFRYPLVELLTGVIFVAMVLTNGSRPLYLVYLFQAALLITVALIDFDRLYIPNQLVVLGLVAGVVLHCILGTGSLYMILLGFLAGGVPMLAVYLVSRGGMGAGDVKLSAMMGVFLGWQLMTVALFLSFLSGAVAGGVLLLTGVKEARDPIPFGPFLALGGIGASLWGWKIIGWYMETMRFYEICFR